MSQTILAPFRSNQAKTLQSLSTSTWLRVQHHRRSSALFTPPLLANPPLVGSFSLIQFNISDLIEKEKQRSKILITEQAPCEPHAAYACNVRFKDSWQSSFSHHHDFNFHEYFMKGNLAAFMLAALKHLKFMV